MNNQPLISVIVPAYNAESYLVETIERIINQSFVNFELLIINDGSTDGTLAIARAAQQEDARVSVVSTKNKGVSSARNSGIAISRGRYITFVDSDDSIDINYLGQLYEDAERSQADIVVSLPCTDDNFATSETEERVLDRRDALINFMYSRGISNSPWAKLYKRELINTIRFDEGISIGEDMKYLYDCLKVSDRVLFTGHKLYSYTPGENGLMNSELSDKAGHPLKAAEYIRNESSDDMKRAADYKLFIEAYGVCRLTYSSNDYRHIYEDGLRAMRLTGPSVIFSLASPLRGKVYSLGAFIFPKFMFNIIKIMGKKEGVR